MPIHLENYKEEPVCRRCSLCCHLVIDGRISNKHCPHILSVGNNRFACRIYQNKQRIGKSIGHGNFCHEREKVPLNYVGCLYNKPEWGKELGVGDCVEEDKI